MQAYRPRRHDPLRSLKFSHPTLGDMEGIVLPGDKVVQFHAIPYATIPGRFKQCILVESLDETDRQFKFPGPACPHTFTTKDVYSGGLYPGEQNIVTDEFGCLTVTLSVPLEQLPNFTKWSDHPQQEEGGPIETKVKVPTMVYIHGGAFHVGKTDAVHDTAAMVAQSVEDGQPVIIASLQYRIGALGFLATPNGAANLGLYDQRMGLEWIQRFIGGFGGDKRKVTLFGESAGGYSICYHMLGRPTEIPLFNRAVIMSGVPGPLMTPVARDEADKAFHEICGMLGIQEQGHVALERLTTLPVQKLVEVGDLWTGNGNFWRSVIDVEFFSHDNITWDRIPFLLGQCSWIESLIVGNTGFEGTPYLSTAQSLTPQTLHSHMLANLSEEATAAVLETYNITPTMDQNLFAHFATRWLGDIIFDAPIHALCTHLATSTAKKVYRYIFDVGNPFVGTPFYNVPHHWVDVYFLFRTLQFRFPSQKLRDVSDAHSRLWVGFANGKEPWGEYRGGSEGLVMVVDEGEGWTQRRWGDVRLRSQRDLGRLGGLWDAWGEKTGEDWVPLRLMDIVERGVKRSQYE